MSFTGKNPKFNTSTLNPLSADPIGPTEGMLQYADGTARAEGVWVYSNANWIPLQQANLGIVSAKSANYTILDDDGILLIEMTTGATDKTVTLPTASANTNRIISVKKIDAGVGTVIVDAEGAETIEGQANVVLINQFESILLICNGVSWDILAQSGSKVVETWTVNETNTTTSVQVTRQGNFVKVTGIIAVTGAFSNTGFVITVPAKYAPSSFYDFTAKSYRVGEGFLLDNGGEFDASLSLRDATTLVVSAILASSTYTGSTSVSPTVPFTWANGDAITFEAEWIVTGW